MLEVLKEKLKNAYEYFIKKDFKLSIKEYSTLIKSAEEESRKSESSESTKKELSCFIQVGCTYLAACYKELSDFDAAIQFYEKATTLGELRYEEEKKDPEQLLILAEAYQNLARLYKKQNLITGFVKPEARKQMFTQVEAIYQKVISLMSLVQSLKPEYTAALARIYLQMQHFYLTNEATEPQMLIINKSFELYEVAGAGEKKKPEFLEDVALGYYNLGLYYQSKKTFEKAKFNFQKAIGVFEQVNKPTSLSAQYTNNLAETNYQLACCCISQENSLGAKFYLATAIKICFALKPKSKNSFSILSKCYNQLAMLAPKGSPANLVYGIYFNSLAEGDKQWKCIDFLQVYAEIQKIKKSENQRNMMQEFRNFAEMILKEYKLEAFPCNQLQEWLKVAANFSFFEKQVTEWGPKLFTPLNQLFEAAKAEEKNDNLNTPSENKPNETLRIRADSPVRGNVVSSRKRENEENQVTENLTKLQKK